MRRAYFLFFLSFVSISSLQAIEIQGRAGISNRDWWGLHIGAFTRIPVSGVFSIQPGALLHTAERHASWGDAWNINLDIPVYASFRIPLSGSVNLRLNAGPYVGIGDYWHFGISEEAGLEWKRYFVGGACFQNCINEKEFSFNLSFGYRF